MRKIIVLIGCASILAFITGCKAGKGTGPNGAYTPEDGKRDEIIAGAAVGIATAMFQPPQQGNGGEDSKWDGGDGGKRGGDEDDWGGDGGKRGGDEDD